MFEGPNLRENTPPYCSAQSLNLELREYPGVEVLIILCPPFMDPCNRNLVQVSYDWQGWRPWGHTRISSPDFRKPVREKKEADEESSENATRLQCLG